MYRSSTALVAALTLLSACSNPEPPRPQDSLGDARGGDEKQDERRAWIEQMHRTAPDVDWRAIERANQNAELTRRTQLATQGGGVTSQAVGGYMWEEVGSRNQAGHTRCAAVGAERGGVRDMYIGSAGGGVWRGPLDGSAWEPISDHVFGGVDDIVVVEPANLADEDIVVYRRGRDVYRSDDGGATWTTATGLTAINQARRMIQLPDAQQTILVLARAWISGTRAAIYASTDGGASFSLRSNWSTDWSGDIWAPSVGPGAGTDVYVIHDGRIHHSVNGGVGFTSLTVVDTNAIEGHLSGSEAGAPTLYVTLRTTQWRLYRSDNAGQTASFVRTLNDYWGVPQSLCGFSADPLAMIVGGIECWRSFDGGASLTRINPWTAYYGNPAARLHADIRGITVLDDPDDAQPADLCYINTDGGTYLSTDMGLTVQNLCLDGLGVSQFYSTLTSANDPDLIVGGTQDQGYQRGFRLPPNSSGPSTPMDQLISGDYGHFVSTDGTHARVVSTYPGFILIQNGEQNPSLDQESFPSGVDRLWLPPVVADPNDIDRFYFLADQLWRYTRTGGNSWSRTLHSTHDFGAGAGSYMTAMAFAPSDAQRAYAVNDSGRIWHSTNGGVSWTEALDSGPTAHYFYGNTLLVDPSNPLHALVGGSGYSTVGVRVTNDGGQTWQPLTQGLPSTLVYDLAWEPGGTGAVYAATEAGAWRFDPGMGAWENVMGLVAPATTYWSVETVEATGRVRFGTYGRGIWDCVVPDGSFGTRYCTPAIPNSTGASGRIDTQGSPVVVDQDLTLAASQLPLQQFGYFLVSSGTDFILMPGGSQGALCLAAGPDLGRFNAQVQSSGNTGSFSIPVDLTAIPVAAGPPHTVVSGETWHFQCWFRDGATSNFTDAVTIDFL
ncbi:MAG: hypothetical protein GY711_34045 [bacterium]|nr:hypothetical protein [bacterium]